MTEAAASTGLTILLVLGWAIAIIGWVGWAAETQAHERTRGILEAINVWQRNSIYSSNLNGPKQTDQQNRK